MKNLVPCYKEERINMKPSRLIPFLWLPSSRLLPVSKRSHFIVNMNVSKEFQLAKMSTCSEVEWKQIPKSQKLLWNRIVVSSAITHRGPWIRPIIPLISLCLSHEQRTKMKMESPVHQWPRSDYGVSSQNSKISLLKFSFYQ